MQQPPKESPSDVPHLLKKTWNIRTTKRVCAREISSKYENPRDNWIFSEVYVDIDKGWGERGIERSSGKQQEDAIESWQKIYGVNGFLSVLNRQKKLTIFFGNRKLASYLLEKAMDQSQENDRKKRLKEKENATETDISSRLHNQNVNRYVSNLQMRCLKEAKLSDCLLVAKWDAHADEWKDGGEIEWERLEGAGGTQKERVREGICACALFCWFFAQQQQRRPAPIAATKLSPAQPACLPPPLLDFSPTFVRISLTSVYSIKRRCRLWRRGDKNIYKTRNP